MEIDLDIFINQPGLSERRAPGDPVQGAAAKAEQIIAVGQQDIGGAELLQAQTQLVQVTKHGGHVGGFAGIFAVQLVEQPAERRFAVSIADRQMLAGLLQGLVVGQLAVMGECPKTAPLLSGERMGIFQGNRAAVGLADMADNGAAFNRVGLHQFGDGRVVARRGIFKSAAALVFVKGDAPAVPMRPGAPAALHQAGKTEADIGRDVRAHTQ